MCTELFEKQESKIWVNQPASFTLNYDRSVEEQDEILLLDEEIEEGIGQWRLMLIATVVRIVVTKEAIEKFIAAKWKQIPLPSPQKQVYFSYNSS